MCLCLVAFGSPGFGLVDLGSFGKRVMFPFCS